MAFRSMFIGLTLCSLACGGAREHQTDDTGGPLLGTGETAAHENSAEGGHSAASADDGTVLDVADPVNRCALVNDADGVTPCEQQAPPNAFAAQIEWGWTDANEPASAITPLVANLTDDNGDGVIDLCDTPDVLALIYQEGRTPGHLAVLDGASGSAHAVLDIDLERNTTPAVGDIDGDGILDIVSIAYREGPNAPPRAVAFHADGEVLWRSADTVPLRLVVNSTVAIANVDAAGDAEVIVGNLVLASDGTTMATIVDPKIAPNLASLVPPLPFPADLDDDGDMEIVYGHAAYHHDGSLAYYQDAFARVGGAHVANFDTDTDPEILVTTEEGLSMLEHDGTIIFKDLRPTGYPARHLNWLRNATVHDFDGDGAAEFAMSSSDATAQSDSKYTVYDPDGTELWSAIVKDVSGAATGTAFDFLGDGIPEAIYGDEQHFWAFDGDTGTTRMQVPRFSHTGLEYPVVADIDNDGSAEVVVVSESGPGRPDTVQAVGEVEDRWIAARRIWNQHNYHVTNVREDGSIPREEPKHWTRLNTVRTQAQITESGGVCAPPQG